MAGPSMEIRRYRDSDYQEVWALHNLALEGTGAHVGNGVWDDDLHNISGNYLDGSGEFVVGVLQGKIVAMGALRPPSGNRTEVAPMRVHPGFQRRGFRETILKHLKSTAVDLGYTELHLETTAQQAPAQKLYIKNDYVEVGRCRRSRFEVIQYEKSLPSG